MDTTEGTQSAHSHVDITLGTIPWFKSKCYVPSPTKQPANAVPISGNATEKARIAISHKPIRTEREHRDSPTTRSLLLYLCVPMLFLHHRPPHLQPSQWLSLAKLDNIVHSILCLPFSYS